MHKTQKVNWNLIFKVENSKKKREKTNLSSYYFSAMSWERITSSYTFIFLWEFLCSLLSSLDVRFYARSINMRVYIFNKNKTTLMINWAWAFAAVSTHADVIYFNFHNWINHRRRRNEKFMFVLFFVVKLLGVEKKREMYHAVWNDCGRDCWVNERGKFETKRNHIERENENKDIYVRKTT